MSDTWWANDPVSEPAARITVNKGPDYGSAIASIESGGRYDILGPVTRTGDRAYGKYQVMGANIGPWSQEVFGQPVDTQTFLRNPQIQDAVFQHKFGSYVSKYGPEGAAKAWFAGEKGMNNPNARDQLGTSVASYGRRFMSALGPSAAQAAPVAAPAAADNWWGNDPIAQAPQDVPQAQPQQSGGMLDKALEPITSYPSVYEQMSRDARGQMSRGIDQLRAGVSFGQDPSQEAGRESQSGALDLVKGVGNVALGGLNFVTSPINAALRTIVGKPIEENTGIPKEYPEFAASLALPGIGLRAATPSPVRAPAPAAAEPITEAGRRIGVDVPRIAVSDNTTLQRAGGALKEIPIVGDPLVKASEKAVTQLDAAAKRTAAGYGSADSVVAGEAASKGITDWITKGSSAIENRLYGVVDNLVNPQITQPLTETARVAQSIQAKRANARIPGDSQVVNAIRDAVNAPGGLNYTGIKDLRTWFREKTPQELAQLGFDGNEAKAVYNALSKDLRSVVQAAGGPQAARAFDRANGVSNQINTRRESLSKIVGLDGSAPPERVLDRLIQMSSTKGNADIGKLMEARKSIGAKGWDEVASAIVQRMGHSAAHPEFSADKFVTAYNNLSPAARNVLFSSTGKGDLARALNDIATVSTAEKAIKRFGNPSRSGSILSGVGVVGGGWMAPTTILPLAIGGNVTARVLASPLTAKPAAQWANAAAHIQLNRSPSVVTKLSVASRALALALERNLGMDAERVYRSLYSAVPVRAEKND